MARSISFDVAAANKASKALEDVAREVTELEKKLDGAGGTIEVDADTGKAREQIAAVDAQLARLNAKSLRIDADTAGVRRDLQVLEAEAKRATGDRKLKVDADIAAAQAKLRALDGAKVAIDVETAAAQAKLAAVEASLSRVDGDKATAHVDVDSGGLFAKLAQIGSRLRDLKAPILIPVAIDGAMRVLSWIGSVSAGLASLGATGVAAGGVTAGALMGVKDAVSELGKATETSAGKAGGSVSASASTMRSAIRGVEAAQRDLRDANENVGRSEQALTDAQDDARRAVEDLDDARRDAIRTLEDYQLRSADMSLRQERASLSVAQAQQRLNEVNSDAKSTSLDRAQAELAVREALQRQNELQVDARRLSEDKADADAKGVEQSDKVVAAQDRIKDANKRVAEAQAGITKAHEQVALAAQRVSDAQLAVQEASKSAGAAAKKAADDGREAFSKLTPEGQRFAQFLRDLVDGPLKLMQDTAQAGLLPGLQSGIDGAMQSLGRSREYVKDIAEGVGAFFDRIGPSAGRAVEAFLRLAKIGGDTSFGPLADTVSDLLDRFTAWANSQDADEISAQIHQVASDVKELWQTGVIAFRGLQLAWEAVRIPVDLIAVPLESIMDLLRGDFSAAIREPIERLQEIYGAVKAFADSIPWLRDKLPELSTNITGLGTAAYGADGSMRGADGAARGLASANRDLEGATRAAKDELLRGEEAGIRYEGALDRAKEAVKRNGAEWSTGSAKGRENRQTLLDLIRASDDYITSLQNQGTNVDVVKQKYQDQRQKLIDVAVQMGMTRAQAEQYITKLMQVPSQKSTRITADTSQADFALQQLQARLSQVNGALSVTNKTGTYGQGLGVYKSSGGWVGANVSSGTPFGGGPKGRDTVPGWLDPNEFVVTAPASRKWGPLLELINRGASPAEMSTVLGSYAPVSVPAQRSSSGGGGGGTVVLQFSNLVVGQEDAVTRAVVAALGQAANRGLLPPSLRVVSQ